MKLRVQALLEKAQENIAACRDLIRTGHPAVAASRAYYAMFYVAEALLLNAGQEFTSHGQVHGAFGQLFAKTGMLDPKFHRYLIDAFRERQSVDYDAPVEVATSDAETLVQQAHEFSAAAADFLRRRP